MQKKHKAELWAKSIKELSAEALKSRQLIDQRRMEIVIGKSKNTNLSRLQDNYAAITTILKQKENMETNK